MWTAKIEERSMIEGYWLKISWFQIFIPRPQESNMGLTPTDMRSLFTSATCLLNVISINDHMDAVKRKQKHVLLCVVMHTHIQKKKRFRITGRVSKGVRPE